MANEKIYGTENDVMFKCLFGAQDKTIENITKLSLEEIEKLKEV